MNFKLIKWIIKVHNSYLLRCIMTFFYDWIKCFDLRDFSTSFKITKRCKKQRKIAKNIYIFLRVSSLLRWWTFLRSFCTLSRYTHPWQHGSSSCPPTTNTCCTAYRWRSPSFPPPRRTWSRAAGPAFCRWNGGRAAGPPGLPSPLSSPD